MNDPASSPSGRSKQWLCRILTAVGAALVITLIIAFIYMLHPVDYDGIGVLGFFALMFAPQLLIIAVIAGLGAIVMWRRWRLPASMFAAACLVALPMSLWPTVATYRIARQHGVPVSFAKALIPDVTLGGIQQDKSIRYATIEGTDLFLDVWSASSTGNPGLRPAMIRVHGGAWIAGTRSELPAWNSWLNELGYVVFDVEYRMPPPVRWLDEVGDVKCAMGWVVANAEQYGIDKNRISILGYSAGAHLAMLAAYTMGDPNLPPSCPSETVKINSIVNIYGPSDLPLGYYGGGSLGYVQHAMNTFIGGPPEEFPDRYRAISPITHVNARTPPTITLLGTSDRIVPVEQADVLTKALHAAGVAHETYLLPVNDHGFDANWSSLGAQFARAKVQAFLEKYN
jgi:acetyl esterase/lipase